MVLHDEVLEVLSCWRMGGDFEYDALEKTFNKLSQEMMASTFNDEGLSADATPKSRSPEPDSEPAAEEAAAADPAALSTPDGLPAINLRNITQEDVDRLNAEFRHRPPMDAIRWLMSSLGGLKVYQFTSFGLSGSVILDLLAKFNYKVPLVFIDTLHHFNETLDLKRAIEKKYPDFQILTYGPGAASNREEFQQLYGEKLWESDEEFYQYLTKVEPTQRALKELQVDIWITGRRRSQGDSRSTLEVLELTSDGRIKFNPACWMTWNEIWTYVKAHNVPYNALLDQGYKSVGDFFATTAVPEDAPERSGRWQGKGRTECGMHSVNRPISVVTSRRTSESSDSVPLVVAAPAAAIPLPGQ